MLAFLGLYSHANRQRRIHQARTAFVTPEGYRRRQFWLAAVLVLQLVGGLSVLLVPGQEVFPLFSWFLFPLTHAPGVRFEIRILGYQGHHYPVAVAPVDLPGAVEPAQLPTLVVVGRNLGRALAAGDEPEVRRWRGLLEGGLIHGVDRYALVEVAFDPIAALRSGSEQVRTVRVFLPGQP
jgi:hypothetical protein